MDRLTAFQAFAAVAEHGGFAPAARRLKLSPTAVTRLVAALEAQLRVRLFNRTTRSVTLTDAGARLRASAERILAELATAERLAEGEHTAPTGKLVITAPLVFGRLHVAPLVCAYLAAHSEVQAELLLADRFINLVDEGVDVAVRIGLLPDSVDVVRRVGATRRVLVASPDYLARRGTPATPADLERHETIAFTGLASPEVWRFHMPRESLDVRVAPRYVTNSADAAIAHAVQHGGLGLLLSYQVAPELARGQLRVVLADYEPPPLPIQLVFPSARWLSPKIRAFVDLAAANTAWDFTAIAPTAGTHN